MVACRAALGLAVFLTLVLPPARAAGPDRLADALALQEAFQEAIRKAEPSIACILVSRSDVYQRWFGEPAPAENSGKLGGFDPDRAPVQLPPEDEAQLQEFKKALQRRNMRFVPPNLLQQELKKKYDLGSPGYVPESYGSGVVIDAQGLVLTNFHVVRHATKVYVRLPGGKGSYADVHAADPRSDLAVLRLLDRQVRPVPLTLGDGGAVRKGQWVISLANPFAAGFEDGSPSASWGIVSNLRRRAQVAPATQETDRARLPLYRFATLLQTDARLNLGVSGGALLNLRGELIGLTSALAALSGTETAGGFAVPFDAPLRRVVETLARGEEVEYGFLGVRFNPMPQPGQETLVDVIPGSAADRAKLQPQDTILAVNGTPVKTNDDLFLALSMQPAGAEVRLDVRSNLRQGGTVRTVKPVLDKFYLPDKGIVTNRRPAFRGLRVDYTSVLIQRDLSQMIIPRGVYVREVEAGSPADTARLQDVVIEKVNGRPVTTPADFYEAVEGLSGPVQLKVNNRPLPVELN